VSFATDTHIRRAERDDLDTIVRWMEEPDFQQFLYGDPARSPKQIREQIVAMLGRATGHTMPGGIYLVIDSKAAGPIGMLSLQSISWRNRSCTIDLYIGNKSMRSGIVTAISVYRTLEYCFDELDLHRVGAYIYSFNSASWRIFERSGAVREVTLREQVQRNGVFHDIYIYGLLRSEFDALRTAQARQAQDFSLDAMVTALAAAAEENR
jgi:RimJ/RimL family protein N-acetyltransferase